MSQTELDEIQLQLKIAIQTHQKLVSKIQLQPQDHGLKVQLHNLQKNIMTMSQKQKLTVQKLRKDLIERPPKSKDRNQNLQVNKETSVETASKKSNVPVQPVSPLRVPQYHSHKSPGSQESVEEQNRRKTAARTPERTPEKKQPKHQDHSWERARELKRKLDFMACIDLVPPDSIKDTPGKRSERKRKSTNNPNFAYGFELERRPKLSNFLASDYFGAKKTKPKPQTAKSEGTSPTTSRPTTPGSPEQKSGNNSHPNTKENMPEENLCHVCQLGGQLLNCDTCRNVYHLQCLTPPLYTVPTGQWSCPKCQESAQRCSALLSLSAVNTYISNKTGKEEEKRKLLKRGSELLQEKTHLQNRTKQLNEILAESAQRCSALLSLSAVNTYISNKTGKEEEKRKLLKRGAELLQEKTHLQNRTKQLNEILARQGVRKQELIEINMKAKQSVENLKNFVKAVQSS